LHDDQHPRTTGSRNLKPPRLPWHFKGTGDSRYLD
jgi:hypothetical protein